MITSSLLYKNEKSSRKRNGGKSQIRKEVPDSLQPGKDKEINDDGGKSRHETQNHHACQTRCEEEIQQ